MCVRGSNPRPVGTRLPLQLRLPGLEDRLHCDTAEIVWTRRFANTDEGSPGMGMRFVEIDAESRAMLREFCDDLVRTHDLDRTIRRVFRADLQRLEAKFLDDLG